MPLWLLQRMQAAGGRIPFHTYMQWVLHDPQHGAYASGRLRIGPRGDFVTASSLGPDFAALLLPQLVAWLAEVDRANPDAAAPSGASAPLALIEAGPGEGTMALELAAGLAAHWPALAARTELVLVEPSAGLAERQRLCLKGTPLPRRWVSFEDLAAAPLRGVVLAHEVLDALSVERIVVDGTLWRQQVVVVHEDPTAQPSLRLEAGEPLGPQADAVLRALGLLPPGPQRLRGWSTELHPELQPWLAACGAALSSGALLVIDYALEAWRYYAPQRSSGTLIAYREQQACGDPLREPGAWDLTAHLCIDRLEWAAEATGWLPLGHCRQGEALLALGLAERLHGLQRQDGPSGDLGTLLARREALLRLVDPHALGDFRWLAFGRGLELEQPRFLREPEAPGLA